MDTHDGSEVEPDRLYDLLHEAMRDYLTHGYRATLVGKYYTVSEPVELDQFCQDFASLAVKAVRYRDEQVRKKEEVLA